MRRDVTYAVVVPIVVVCVAVILMIWAMSGTSGSQVQGPTAATTGTASTRTNDNAVRPPSAPSNDMAGDHARATKGPESSSR